MNAAFDAVLALSGVLAAVVAWLAWRDTRREQARAHDEERIQVIVQAGLAPVAAKQQELQAGLQAGLQGLASRLDNVSARQNQMAQDTRDNAGKLGTVLDRLSVLETKIEVFWRSVAMDAARIIHSPDPARAHTDALLDAFINGTITAEQASELRKILVFMRDWEPGVPSDYPVYAGEQVAAAILLRTMDHAMGAAK